MKTERKIQLVTDEYADPPVEELTGREAEIDALLRSVADECSAEIDFEAIKLRAVEAAKAKRAKRGRIRKAIGYGIIAAASLMIGIVVLHSFKGLNGKNSGPALIDAHAGDVQNTIELPVKNANWPADDGRMELGAVSESDYKEISASVDSLFPTELPDSMKKIVDSGAGKVSATGYSTRGSTLGYECSMEDGSAKNLNTGEAWFEEEGEDLFVYWQVTEDHYIKVHFVGFDKNCAYQMFMSVSDSVKQQSK